MVHLRFGFFLVLALFTVKGAVAQIPTLKDYNVIWNSPSKNSSESMPCGGGDIGLNVWVENGDILFYLSRTGAFDENNQFLKLGRVRVTLSNNPFTGADFKQELRLKEGAVHISGAGTKVVLWVDVFRPMVHVEIESAQPVSLKTSYETWRHKDHETAEEENRANSHKDLNKPRIKVITYKDSVRFNAPNEVVFYHQNRKDAVFDMTVEQQGLGSVKDSLYNPLENLVFGGMLVGKGLVNDGVSYGTYVDTNYQAWHLKSRQASQKHQLEVALYVAKATSADAWTKSLFQLVNKAKQANATAKSATLKWWNDFWQRSHVHIQSTDEKAWQVGRNYQLFRYMLACNAYGEWPTKFNGGLFTFDPGTVSSAKFSPDFRRWGGGTMTGQNQRLVYFPMFKNGDFDMLPSQFNFYTKNLRNAELRSKVYWDVNGASFTEQIENFGLPNNAEYGWARPTSRWIPLEEGVEDNDYLAHDWESSLEFCLMMIDLHAYTGADIKKYIPFIESCLRFYDEYYQKRNGLDKDGKLIIYPGSGLERYKMAVNPVNTVSALKTVLSRFVALPERFLSASQKAFWQGMLQRIPPLETMQIEGKMLLNAYKNGPYTLGKGPFAHGNELPELYPIYPWGQFGVGLPQLDIALNTWNYNPSVVKILKQNLYLSWRQEAIFAARLGLTEEAAKRTLQKMKDSPYRFPAFFEPGHDWTPDHNWGGSGMIAVQEMLMQTVGDTIYLLPAWPKNWEVDFKLHAPQNTTITGVVKQGKLVKLEVFPKDRRADIQFISNEWK
jgi:hypothetical protein